MGEPAIPPPLERRTIRTLSEAIVASVTNDELMPLPLHSEEHGDREFYLVVDVELLVFKLAQEAAMLAWDAQTCDGSCDIALARRQVGPDGDVPGNAKECAELWEREAARLTKMVRELGGTP